MVYHALTYAAPRCEYDTMTEPATLLAASDLTDEGAGDFLTPGDIYNL